MYQYREFFSLNVCFVYNYPLIRSSLSADGRGTAQLLLLHLCEQVPECRVPRDAGGDHQQPVTKIQGWERQTSALPPEMTVRDTMP